MFLGNWNLFILLIGIKTACLSIKPKPNVFKDTELVLAFLVHRHGDRTPLSSNLSFSNHPEALARIIEKYGYGELTPRGKYRGYQIGQFIRRRYSCLLSPQYNESQIYLRSTDITRAKMTSLTSMAAVYPATEDNWSKTINWTPVPYTTVDKSVDYLRSYSSCAKYNNFYESYKPPLPQYRDVLEKWSASTGYNFTDTLQVFRVYDDYYCQKSLGLPLESNLEALFPEIEKAAGAAVDAIFGNEEYLPYLSGVLLNQFFNASSTLIAGSPGPAVRVYSSHDITVYGILAASKIRRSYRPGAPKYGAIFGLELRKLKTGRYVVLPLYVPDPAKSKVFYLPIEGCRLPCDYEAFQKITSKFVLDEDTWIQSCVESNK